ncbi:aldehyde ferredoxin oxidoreductase family protein [Lutispora saccharofermentans]|uniref:Aldehyde ferredoxin oxidoreductase family protein n=1 Tax=Lutispora saccharofermentans TaxID=3024236 RepID=A0ABT1NCZ4_9FIRM|nr:aldehyde ferredoxin oxidoreductase family protein [Lutispora saccharofermentans]MCQ1528201.1 aldehyde ferredoxin oxidoreductase family protein [Lutispora saccharofermentans]
MDNIKGNVIRVNLSLGSINFFTTEDFYRFLGGRGYGDWVLLNEVSKDAEPLSEENKVIIATGCFTGTSLPGSSRIALVTKNALSGGISYSSGGGNWGPELKKAGIDAIIIEGKSSTPKYLFINNGNVELRDASHLWGMTTWDTEDAIKEELKDDGIRAISIGPAGENLSKVACVMIDKAHALAWGGSGAILGCKMLKAIAVKGDKDLKMHDKALFNDLVKSYSHILLSSPASASLRKGGTHGMAGVGGWSGKVPTSVRNLQEEYWDPDKAKKVSEEAYKPYEKKRTRCYNCPLACLHYYEMERDGEVLSCEGMHANSVRGFASNWDIDDPFEVLKIHSLCNKYGMDVDGVSASVAWAIECFEEGIINEEDTFGLKLKWGNSTDLITLVEQMAFRKDFGDLLSEGVSNASRIIGRGSEKYAMQIKGVGINEQGVHSHKAWSLAIATSTRGSGHLSGAPQTENRQIPEQVGKWLFNCEEAGIPGSYKGKGKLVAWYEIYKAIIDSIGICYFDAGWYEVALADIKHFTRMYQAFTGKTITDKEMWNIAEKILNLERAFNTIHAGFTRKDDYLPERIMEEPLNVGPFKGEYMDREKFDAMLDEYYETQGLCKETGLQKRETIERLGMDYLIKYFSSNNVSIE